MTMREYSDSFFLAFCWVAVCGIVALVAGATPWKVLAVDIATTTLLVVLYWLPEKKG